MTQSTVIHRLRRIRDMRQATLVGEPGMIDALDGREPKIPPIERLRDGYLIELKRQRPDLVDEARELISYIGKERK